MDFRNKKYFIPVMMAISIWVGLVTLLWVVHGIGLTRDNPINADGYGYYAYLTAGLIDGNLRISRPEKYEPTRSQLANPALVKLPDKDRYLIKYPMGVAIMVLPFFLGAKIISELGGLGDGGYGQVYQWFTGAAASTYATIGLLACYYVYKKETSKSSSLVSVALLLLATNLATYSAYSPLMSHAFSFCLTALVWIATAKWWQKPSYRSSLILGGLLGLAFLIRNTQLLLWILILGYGFGEGWNKWVQQIKQRKMFLLTVVGVFFVMLLPQLLYYWYLTGKVWFFPYVGEGFNWLDPAWYGVLVSPRRGLFFWTPVMILAVIGWAWNRKKVWFRGGSLFLLISTYVIASWGQWWYGDSYGHRAFIDLYPVLGLGLAIAIERFKQYRYVWPGVLMLMLVLIGINWKLMWQWWTGELPRDHTKLETVIQAVIY